MSARTEATLPSTASLSSTPGRVRHPGPELGEHNDEVYRGLLGLGDGEMEELTAGGVI